MKRNLQSYGLEGDLTTEVVQRWSGHTIDHLRKISRSDVVYAATVQVTFRRLEVDVWRAEVGYATA